MQHPPSVVSLFSGAGGLDVGLEQAGWQIVSANDFAPHSMRTLRQSQQASIPILGSHSTYMDGTYLLEADVQDVRASDLRPQGSAIDWRPDLVAGGPPCQPWSSAGLQQGLNDPRGKLIEHFLRLIDELNPRFVLFENVRGLLTARGATGTPGEVLRSIQADLTSLGYASHVSVLNAADYGAAQRRVRVILVATKNHIMPEFPLPTHHRFGSDGLIPWKTLGQALVEMPMQDEDSFVRPSGTRAAALRALEPGTGLKTQGRVMANRPSGHWGYRQDAFLADLELPARTVRAAGTPDWVRTPGDTDLRRLTWQECAMLQGFPAQWRFHGTTAQRFQQIGNAVQTDMARAVGEAIRSALEKGETTTPPVTPEWSQTLNERIRYTKAEHRTNGHLRVRNARVDESRAS